MKKHSLRVNNSAVHLPILVKFLQAGATRDPEDGGRLKIHQAWPYRSNPGWPTAG